MRLDDAEGKLSKTGAPRADNRREKLKLAIVGGFGGTHIGGSLARAAVRLGLSTTPFDIAGAARGNRFLRALAWRLGGHRPLRLKRFSADVTAACADARPDVLISTGAAALTQKSLAALRNMNITCINYSTDDPWNPHQVAPWYLQALPSYSLVFTARQANIPDFRKLGCRDVRYLPFGYDDSLFSPPHSLTEVPSYDVLFVGGADRDRVEFVTDFMRKGPPVTLVGGYWAQNRVTPGCALGLQSPESIRMLTAAAKVNLCLVRRANRDDNVMRSCEIGATGGCMIAEDTAGHRAIFGPDGAAVRYFRTPEEAAARASELLADPIERKRLALSVLDRISRGGHTYRDRLKRMLKSVGYHEFHGADPS